MENIKALLTNLVMILGMTITWIETIDSVLRLIATAITITIGIITLYRLKKKSK